jgi:DNA-binding NarL/FixJ family response regulator
MSRNARNERERKPEPPREPHRRRILVVDDHPIVRHGLTQLLNQEPDLIVCAQAATSAEALQQVAEAAPDLALVDISMDGLNGIELAKSMHALRPQLPLLVLSMHDETLYAERALRAGAKGYLMKQEAPEILLKAVRTCLAGECYLSERMQARVLAGLTQSPKETDGRLGIERLSDRELEIFELIGNGHSTRRIADLLHLSVKTVETHCQRIKAKLGLADATELLHHAVHWVHTSTPAPDRKP